MAFDFRLACGSVVTVALLQYFLVNDVAPGPRWLAPAIEIALVIPLAIAFRINQKHARVVGEALGVVLRRRETIRKLAFALTAVITAMNFGALFELVRALMVGTTENGRTLLLDAVKSG